MDLRDVSIFVETAHAGTLTGSARRLGITPMAASRGLAALEQELAVRLVQRTTRVLALTPEGEAFLPHAQAILDDEAGARAAVAPSDSGASGVLRITTSLPFGRKMVAPFMPRFMNANPLVRVDLLLTDGIVDIVAQGIDLAIRIARLRDSTLIARKLAENPRGLYAAPAYLAARGVPRRMADLAHHECLLATGVAEWSFESSAGKSVSQRVAGRFSATSVDALHEACLGGLGIALLSDWNVVDDIASGALLPVPLADAAPEARGVWAIHPSARFVPPKVRLFVAAFEAHLATR